MGISDVLSEAARDIRGYQREGDSNAEVVLVLDIMHAVQMMPGRDRNPDGPNTFAGDLAAALERYRQTSARADG